MIVKCKVAEECPMNLDICCGTCSFKRNCGNACPVDTDPEKCPEAEVITEALTAFKSAVPETIGKITTLIKLKKQMDEQEKQLKEQLVKAMEFYGIKAFENEVIKMTYVAPTIKTTVDSKALKKDHPDLFAQYTKSSNISAYVKVGLKGGDK
mgnify:CR=1 FL=1